MQRTALASAFLMTSLVLAGCLGGDDSTSDSGFGPGFDVQDLDASGHPVPRLLCFEPLDADDDTGMPIEGAEATRCNFEMTPDAGRQGNEVTIAVNPTDPRNVVGGAKDYYPADAGECVWDGVYVTHDGGRSAYEDRSFDGSPWRLVAGDTDGFAPNYATSFWCTTDPVAYFDVNGRLYYVLMAYQTDPVTGSKTGNDTDLGGLNDWAFNRATQIVAISDDGGDTFHTFTPVLEGSYPVDFHDKAWLAASADGTIHIMWLAMLAPGNLYCRSTDEGQSYLCTDVLAPTASLGQDIDTPVASIGGGPSGQGSFLEVGTGPEVYAIWSADGVQFRRSMDTGASWELAVNIQGTNPADMPGLDGRDRRGGFPALASDRNPDSPFADSLYISWQDGCMEDTWSAGCIGDGSSIWVIASHDKGETWTEPVRISGVDPEGDWNIFATVSVSPGGVVDVSWMSSEGQRRIACHDGAPDCVANYGEEYPALTQHYAYSLDGGATWSEVSDVRDADDGGWDPSLCHHQNSMVFIGDYNDIDSSWQAAHPVWPDSRLGPCDVYTATIQRPAFAEGWSEDGMDAAAEWMAEHPL